MKSKYRKSEQNWKNDALNSNLRDYSFKSASGEDVKLLYYPDDEREDYIKTLNFPGQYPYTRGIHPKAEN